MGAALIRWLVLVLVLAVVSGAAACGGEDARPRDERRAACYPACLAEVIARCPLVTACRVSEEADASIGEPLGETSGVATCFDSGERLRYATGVGDGLEHYHVATSDGGACYEAIGKFPDYDIFVDGALVAKFEDQRAHDFVDVGCGGMLTRIDVPGTGNRDCGRLPWDPARTCNPTAGCTFGQ